MLKRVTTLVFLFLLATSLFAQSKYVLRSNGDLQELVPKANLKAALQASNIKTLNGKAAHHIFSTTAAGLIDTIDLAHDFTVTWPSNAFAYDGQDVMMQWFVAPADLIIKAAGFSFDSADDPEVTTSVRLIKLGWTEEELRSVDTPIHMGYYPSDGDGANNASPFPEDATGEWVDLTSGEYPTPPWANADFDLWSDFGFGWPILPEAQPSRNDFQWVEMSNLGFEPEVSQGEIFGVVVINDGIRWEGTDDRIAVNYGTAAGGFSGWKYYENGRLDPPNDKGWWHREYAWDFGVIVELTSDRAPQIVSVESLPTTLDEGPFEVTAEITDDNPSGGAAGIASAKLMYTINDGAVQSIDMTGSEPNFTASLPAGSPGDDYVYWVEATDVGSLVTTSAEFSFGIFKPTPGVPSLVVFNGEDGTGYPDAYYFRQNPDFVYDVWAYGPLSAELVDNYNHIFEICINGPADYNREVIRTWLESSGDNDYFLSGMEWLGADNGFTDSTYAAGTFEYDILGVENSYNDITYDGATQTGFDVPSLLFAQEGSLLGGALYDAFTAQGTDSLQFDPVYEVGLNNWMDAFDVAEGIDVDVMVETRAIGGAVDVQTLACVAHHTLPAGNKIVFMSMDPIAINSSPDYVWYGDSTAGIQYQAVDWFDPVVGVDEDVIAKEFRLEQNYPNPFNPTTVIKYSLTEKAKVSLKVYDILGKEVATLVDETQGRGVHELNFRASNLASGMYIYTLRAGDFVSSKKMMLLK